MDAFKAKKLENELKDKFFLDYKVIGLINFGKSAAVFETILGKSKFALKIFDNELIERFGYAIQLNRIEKEIALKNHSYASLVKIVAGGKTVIDEDEYYYIVMEFISGKNLYQYINENDYDQNFILSIIDTLFSLTEQLLKDGIVHRDIKPENIMIDAENRMILMDLGVLKLVGSDSLTDIEEKQFIGTLRYASPEYLRREEKDEREDWRAINLYQIGCVLHDLIMRKELFADEIPYTNLVYAIKEKRPTIQNNKINNEIIQLAYDLLAKDPQKRNELVNEERIKKVMNSGNRKSNADQLFAMIKNKTQKNRITLEELESISRTKKEKDDYRKKLANSIDSIFKKCLQILVDKQIVNNFKMIGSIRFSEDNRMPRDVTLQNHIYQLGGNIEHGFLRDFFIVTRFANDDKGELSLSMLGVLPSRFLKIKDSEASKLFENIGKEINGIINHRTIRYKNKASSQIEFKFNQMFEGIFSSEDIIEELLLNNCLGLINTIINRWEKEVASELENRKNVLTSNQSGVSISIAPSVKTEIIEKWEL